ncbi:MAG: molybdate ABC transporter substrate-binding protein [Acidobacteria bacterium]|nr:MAG: molybdate ABC transporter substrate-binding protein [Acidobacteriota bacterium]
MIATILLAATIRVSAAASLTDALGEIARRYGKDAIVFNFGASSLLARQIIEGAPADAFVSADEQQMNRLQQRGLIMARRNILSNTLVVVVPADSRIAIGSPNELIAVRKIAIAQPDTVPAGVYAREYLQHAGVWDRVASRIVPTENVRAALAAVESGNVDAGIVYLTDGLSSRRVKIAYRVTNGPKITYPAAVIAGSREKAAALRFLDYLQSDPARQIFRRYGFLLP